MTPSQSTPEPVLSVVIPCFNHGNFLANALDSVFAQDYPYKEIIVVDDGSTDNTCQISEAYKEVIYIYQDNQGLSAARNTGIKCSTGDYIVFLDADDIMLPNALVTQLNFMHRDRDLAFVSGGHIKVDNSLAIIEEVKTQINEQHYLHLLQGNYIGMHAAVMYRQSIFKTFLFDTSLTAAEDYDLYLKIALGNKIAHHTHPLALYRQHRTNMSSNIPLMLKSVLQVLKRQRGHLKTAEQKKAYQKGLQIWKDYYCNKMYLLLIQPECVEQLIHKQQSIKALCMFKPALYIRFLINKFCLGKTVKKDTAPVHK